LFSLKKFSAFLSGYLESGAVVSPPRAELPISTIKPGSTVKPLTTEDYHESKHPRYTYENVVSASTVWFGGDAMAAQVFAQKYALQDDKERYLELSPDDMFRRLAYELARASVKRSPDRDFQSEFNRFLSLLRQDGGFGKVVLQGSPMSAIGNPFKLQSASNCFASGTKVLTINRGVVPIEQIQPGDCTVTHTGAIKEISQIHKNPLGDRTLFEVKCFRTPSFKVTGNHKMMALTKEQDGWGETPQWTSIENLRVGDWIAIPKKMAEPTKGSFKLDVFDEEFSHGDFTYSVEREAGKFRFATQTKVVEQSHKHWIPSEIPIDRDFAYFLGLWLGDGCVFGVNNGKIVGSSVRNRNTKKRKILGITLTFGNHETRIIQFAERYLERIGVPFSTSQNAKQNTYQILVCSTALGCAFEQNFGRGFAGKRLHESIFSWDENLTRSLLLGLVDSDGTITSSGEVRVVLSNPDLIRQFYHIARSCGLAVGYSESLSRTGRINARLDFGKDFAWLGESLKTYDDNRQAGSSASNQVKISGGYTLVRISAKNKVQTSEEFVYTLGVEDDHSYAVEGLISQNCYVISSPADSYGGIMLSDQHLAQLMKRRAGVGLDLSTIRPKGLATKNAAKTTDGIGVFMQRFSNTCREVAQAGRRGALMLTIDCHHPEVLTFINIKLDETKVTGANISVRYSQEFYDALVSDGEYEQRFPVEPGLPEYQVRRKVKAREVWEAAMQAAWKSAEPGALFWNIVQQTSPSDIYAEEGFASISTNPCFAGNTLVAVADGRGAVPIKQLAEEGAPVPVYSVDPATGIIDIKWGRNPRVTGTKERLLRITTDKGFAVDVTPNHGMMLRDGSRVEAKDLQPGMSLSPFTSEVKEAGENYNHKVVSVEALPGEHQVYNITVDDNHTLAVVQHVTSKQQGLEFVTIGGVNTWNCGEIVLNANDSCRLTALNLKRFVKDPFLPTAIFDYDGLEHAAYQAQEIMDLVVDLEAELIDRIIAKIESDPEPEHVKLPELNLWQEIKRVALAGRRTGLGFTALGDAMAMVGIRYGSDESVEMAGEVAKRLNVGAFKASVDMAEQHGAFPIFRLSKELGHPWVERLLDACGPETREKFEKFGRRNISLTTIAPTGTVSIMTQSTSGVEPVFMPYYTRRRKLSDHEIAQGLSVDFVDQSGDKWHEYPVFHHELRNWLIVQGVQNPETLSGEELRQWTMRSPYWGATAMDQQWEKGVEIQAACQLWISHSISRTANLPNDAPVELVDRIYRAAWASGCKGYTVYRDGSRSGVLVSADQSTVENNIPFNDAPKRPEVLPADVHHVRYKGEEWTVLVGLLEGEPFEVFAGPVEDLPVPASIKVAEVRKHPRKNRGARYELVFETPDGQKNVRDIAKALEAEHNTLTRLTSLSLRHGAKIQFVVEQLQRDESSFLSFSRVLARTLKTYIPDGTAATKAAFSDCSTPDLCEPVYAEGCLSCKGCGKSKCG